MPSLDTNVLVRHLVRDDERQTAQAGLLISNYYDALEALFVPLTVTLELEWVLRSAYGVTKPGVLNLYNRLLESRELSFQDEEGLERALFLYRNANVDFADCLHATAAHSHNRLPLVIFDRKAARLAEVELLRSPAISRPETD
ncbi:MAG: PIN domain-containing protein [Gammaproteobacteria bacterium]|nr:PIN domain-containing protein [Gammaproteobacteria bacterium]